MKKMNNNNTDNTVEYRMTIIIYSQYLVEYLSFRRCRFYMRKKRFYANYFSHNYYYPRDYKSTKHNFANVSVL